MGGDAVNKEIKAKWIEALRSGKYIQAKGQLHDGDGFCCLGVLCDVLGVNKEYDEERRSWYFGNGPDRDWEVLPGRTRDAAELGGCCGQLPRKVQFNEKEFEDLAHLNDAGADFNFIADVIEKQL